MHSTPKPRSPVTVPHHDRHRSLIGTQSPSSAQSPMHPDPILGHHTSHSQRPPTLQPARSVSQVIVLLRARHPALRHHPGSSNVHGRRIEQHHASHSASRAATGRTSETSDTPSPGAHPADATHTFMFTKMY
jgi:hypothetical protein